MSKKVISKLCTLCGVERPLEDFLKADGVGYRKKACNREHDEPSEKIKAMRKARRLKRAGARKPNKTMIEQRQYDDARHRGPRRVTQMKVSRLPLSTPTGMTRNDYVIYLTSPHWIGFRDRYRAERSFACFVCGEAGDDLHHITYSRVGCEEFEDVVPLCRDCHKEVHGYVKAGVQLRTAHVYTRNRHLQHDH